MQPCRKEEDVDPEQIRKDIERLELTKKKRSVSDLCPWAAKGTLESYNSHSKQCCFNNHMDQVAQHIAGCIVAYSCSSCCCELDLILLLAAFDLVIILQGR